MASGATRSARDEVPGHRVSLWPPAPILRHLPSFLPRISPEPDGSRSREGGILNCWILELLLLHVVLSVLLLLLFLL